MAKRRKKGHLHSGNKIIQIGVLFFIIYVIFTDFKKHSPLDNISLRPEKDKEWFQINKEGAFNLAQGVTKGINRLAAGTLYKNLKEGTGQIAYCGMNVDIRYTFLAPDKKVMESNELSIVLGKGDFLEKLLARNIEGMREGGIREVTMIPISFYGPPDKNFSNILLPLKIELLSVKDKSDHLFKTIDESMGAGNPVLCGDKAVVNYEVYSPEGKLLKKSAAPLTLFIGSENLPKALERGIPGMLPGGKRLIVASPELLKTKGESQIILESKQILHIQVTLESAVQ